VALKADAVTRYHLIPSCERRRRTLSESQLPAWPPMLTEADLCALKNGPMVHAAEIRPRSDQTAAYDDMALSPEAAARETSARQSCASGPQCKTVPVIGGAGLAGSEGILEAGARGVPVVLQRRSRRVRSTDAYPPRRWQSLSAELVSLTMMPRTTRSGLHEEMRPRAER